jgi:FtsH-binding integral membrane protein
MSYHQERRDYGVIIEDDEKVHLLGGLDDQTVKKGFLRKVYGILSAQILVTFIISAWFMLHLPTRDWVIHHAWLQWVGLAGTIGTIIALFFKSKEHPTNMYLLGAFTLIESYTVGLICAIYSKHGYNETVLLAFALTSIVFVSLTIFCFQTKIDFTFLGGFLFVMLILFSFWGLANWIFGWQTSFVYSLLGALLFSGYVLYDTSLILQQCGPDEYIFAAINLYLDFINLFLYILQMLSKLRD